MPLNPVITRTTVIEFTYDPAGNVQSEVRTTTTYSDGVVKQVNISISGQGAEVTASGATISVAPNSQATITGNANTLEGLANSTVTVIGNNNHMTSLGGSNLNSVGDHNTIYGAAGSNINYSGGFNTITAATGAYLSGQGHNNNLNLGMGATVQSLAERETNIHPAGNNLNFTSSSAVHVWGNDYSLSGDGSGVSTISNVFTTLVNPSQYLYPPQGGVYLIGGGWKKTINEEGEEELEGSTLPVYVGSHYVLGNQTAVASGFVIAGIYGGTGDSTFLAGGSGGEFHGGYGENILLGQDGNYAFNYSLTNDGNLTSGKILAGNGNNHIVVGNGDSLIQLGNGNNIVSASSGNNTIAVGNGTNSVTAYAGDNFISVGDGQNLVTLWGGNNTVTASGTLQVALRGGGDNTIIGSSNGTLNVSAQYPFPFDELTPLGNSLMVGGSNGDHIEGAWGNNTISGGGGNDTLVGGGGALGGSGDGANILDGGDGNDRLLIASYIATATMYGGSGDDTLEGGISDETMYGGEGNDTLSGIAGFDYLDGGAGNDVLTELSVFNHFVDSTLVGGAGDDTLTGYGNHVTYLFGLGDGNDTIDDSSLRSTIKFGAGIAPSDVRVQGVSTPNQDIILQIQNTSDSITIADRQFSSFYDFPQYLNQVGGGEVVFADGTVWDVLTLQSLIQGMTLTGTDGSDPLYGNGGRDLLTAGSGDQWVSGGGGDDTLIAGSGTDTLIGYTGDDLLIGSTGRTTYVFGLGDYYPPSIYGHDTIQASTFTGLNNDTIELGYGVLSSGVTLQADAAGDVTLHIQGSSDVLSINNFLNSSFAQGAGRITFTTDGTVWDSATILAKTNGLAMTGSGGSDLLTGTVFSDTLNGGTGNDTLIGDNGNDTYVFQIGDGQDTVIDTASPLQSNTLTFGPGITSSDVIFTENQTQHTLSIGYGAVGDTITLVNFDPNGVYGSLAAKTLLFDDGSQLSLSNQFPLRSGLIRGTIQNDTLELPSGDSTVYAGLGDDTVSGSTGNDYIYGEDGNDSLYAGSGSTTLDGGTGNDWLEGGSGTNYLQGGAGDDRLIAAGGPTTLGGGTGNDTLIGGSASDTYIFGLGDGQDIIFASGSNGSNHDTVHFGPGISASDVNVQADVYGDITLRIQGTPDSLIITRFLSSSFAQGTGQITFEDGTVWDSATILDFFPVVTLTGTDGPDFLQGLPFNDLFIGGGGNDYLDGTTTVNDTMMGGDGNDTLFGGTGANDLHGDAGNDQLYAGGGSTTLDGGTGDDVLFGGNSSDIYVFGIGDGHDTIVSSTSTGSPNDTIRLGAGISPGSVTLQTDIYGDLLLGLTGATDQLTVQSYFSYPQYQAERIEFADGTVWDTATILGQTPGLVLTDTTGGVYLQGSPLSDTLSGAGGNDTLAGGTGNDIYLFDRGHGQNTILESNYSGNDVNTIQLASGIAPTDVTLQTDFYASLLLGITGTSDQLIIPYYFSSPQDQVEQVTFADGTTWNTATILSLTSGLVLTDGSGDGYLQGTSLADTLSGGGGNDYLSGGAGNDTYVFNQGDGIDTIQDMATTGGGNRIQFGTGITRTDLTITQDEVTQTLTIQVGGSATDQLVLTNFDPTGVNGSLVVQTLAFADGSTAQLADLLSPTSVITGTEGSEVLTGTPGNDTIDGLGGDDSLTGLEGDDTLSGGTGNDVLEGDAGNDVLSGGDGNDILNGGAGADVLSGGDGDDILYIDADDTSVNGGAGSSDQVIVTGTAGVTLDVAAAEMELAFGAGGNDTFTGTTSTSALFMDGGAGDDVLTGGSANDTLAGGDGTDHITGGLGNDILNGGAGADVLSGGDGDDILYIDADDTSVNGGAGSSDQVIVTGTAGVTLDVAAAEVELAFGAGGNDTFTGTTSTSALFMDGGAGDDVLTGGSANDTLAGGDGTDHITGGLGNDILNGGAGADVLSGGDGDDILYIDADDTSVNGGAGSSDQVIVTGTAGVTLDVAAAEVELAFGAGGNDTFTGTTSTSALFMDGGAGDDVLTGGSANDTLAGGDGNDSITGGAGNDILNGGAGDDTYFFNLGDGIDTITEATGPGTGNTIVFGPGVTAGDITLGLGSLLIRVGTGGDAIHLENFDSTNVLGGPHGIDTFRFTDNTTLTYTQLLDRGFDVPGTAGDDLLIGTNVDDRLIGGAGNDRLEARAGDDFLDGGTGADQLLGEQGDDTYVVDHAGDVVTEQLNEGTDTVQSSLTYTLGANLENLILTGATAINGTGNTLTNVLTGNSANNVLDGGTGVDTLVGGTGNDTYVVDNTGDVVTELTNEGTDTVQSSVTYTLAANVENLTLTGAAAINGTGNTLDNVLIGNSANNVLDGGIGADALTGGTGDDTYVVDNTGDLVTELVNGGTDTVQSSVTWTLGANLENLTLIGTTAIAGTGNSLNNVLTGNSGNNVLDGGTGVDTLVGGTGNDTYVVDNTGDVVTELTNEGTDTVQSSVTYTLAANVENLTLTGAAAINGTGNTLDNVLIGNSANNVLDGGIGADALTGGTGDDTYVVDNTGDLVTELVNGGTDTVQSSVTWTLGANLENLTLIGTTAIAGTGNSLNNVLTGNSGNNVLDGGTGVDTLVGGTGNDTYIVDNTNDVVTELTNEGTDTVQSSVTYTLAANVENLTLTGAAAINGTGNTLDNVLIGNSAANTLTGGAGNDTYVVSTGDTVVEAASAGTDTVQSDVTQTLAANVENLVLTGASAINGTGNTLNNALTGNSANNVLDGGTGADALAGGAGNDTYVVDNTGDVVTELTNEGTDTVQSSVTYTLAANVENLTLTGATAINGTGNTLDNVLTGNSAANTLTGGAGNDTLDGGTGNDTMIGGTGNDTYVVNAAGDVVTENLNEGTDTVQSSVTYTLAANVENLTLTGATAINGTGNTLDNVLIGNSAANTLTGGAGNDTYVVSTGDTVVEAASAGTDTVQSDVTQTLAANVENLVLTGASAINGTGNTLNNALTGNSANNVLDGGTGADALAGGAGNDTYVVDNTGDVVTELTNEGTDTVQSSVTYTLAANVENLTLTGATAINGTGNTLDNVLTGNSAANTLTGGAGNDTLDGGTGNDTMIGGTGNDTYVVNAAGDVVTENLNEGTDTVQSSVTYTLAANVENLTLTGANTAMNGTGNSLDNVLIGNSANNTLTGGAGNDTLDGGTGNDTMIGGTGNDTYVVNATGDVVTENANEGTDTVQSSILYTLGANVENLTLTGTAAINGTGNTLNNILTGNSGNNTLTGGAGNDTLTGGAGTDTLVGGTGNDTYVVNRGEGQDTIQDADATAGNTDKLLYGTTINPLDLVLSRQANDLRLAIHGGTEQVTIQNWYTSPTTNQVETIQAGNGQTLLSTQVDQLIQAMAGFTAQTGLTWDQGIDQQPQDVQAVLAASWQ